VTLWYVFLVSSDFQDANIKSFFFKFVFAYFFQSLKGPKHEIFESEFFTQIRPVWLGDLGTGEKNRNFASLSLDMKIFAANILLSV
jgi:hypothetical protein